MAETFGFALGAERFPRLIKPFQRGIFIRMDIVDDLKLKLLRQLAQHQRALFLTVGAPRQAIHFNGDQG